jgi:hypothetical protein
MQLRDLIVVAAWYIWWMRRRRSHGEQVPLVQNCVTSIRAITANSNTQVNTDVNSKWLRPRCHMVKVNVDAVGASRAVIRNGEGGFLAAGGVFIPRVDSASMAEALAMLHGLKLAQNLGYTKHW